MQTTFYIASPFGNYEQVRKVAGFLIQKGWMWADKHDWTLDVDKVEPVDPDTRATWAVKDIHAALNADVFVLLLKDKASAGAHGEMTARWAAHRCVYGIRQGGDSHLFHSLPGITWYETVEDFIQAWFGA